MKTFITTKYTLSKSVEILQIKMGNRNIQHKTKFQHMTTKNNSVKGNDLYMLFDYYYYFKNNSKNL